MKKAMKRILSFALAMVMILAMGITVSAAPVYRITVKNDSTKTGISIDGKTFTAYKIFNLSYAPATPTTGETYAYTIADAFEDYPYTVGSTPYMNDELVKYVSDLKPDSKELHDFAKYVLANLPKDVVKATATATGESADINLDNANAGPGYYLVTGAGKPSEGGEKDEVITACILKSTKTTVEVNIKASAPKIDKEIVGADSVKADPENKKGTAVNVGDKVEFKLTSKVPNMEGYTQYTYVITDTLSEGLTFNDDVKIKVGGIGIDASKFTVDKTGGVVTINLLDFYKNYKDKADAAIEVTYSANLNENALNRKLENNTVQLTYSNNPNDNTKTNDTPEKKTYVYNFDIVINKYTGDLNNNPTPLAGAKFVLSKKVSENGTDVVKYYHWNETDKKVEWYALPAGGKPEDYIDEDPIDPNNRKITAKTTELTGTPQNQKGITSFQGLDAGNYDLWEIKAPDGYNPVTSSIPVEITVEYKDTGEILLPDPNNNSQTNVVLNGDRYERTQNVENKSGSELPETGGMGTTLFYVFGGLLVLAAAGMLIAKKRTPEANQE